MNDTIHYDYAGNSILTRVYDILEYGEENAKSGKRIAEELDIDKRQVEKEVFEARKHGIPICSSTKGYFRGNEQEKGATWNSLFSRWKSTGEMLQGLKKAFWGDKEPDNQIQLSDLFDMDV